MKCYDFVWGGLPTDRFAYLMSYDSKDIPKETYCILQSLVKIEYVVFESHKFDNTSTNTSYFSVAKHSNKKDAILRLIYCFSRKDFISELYQYNAFSKAIFLVESKNLTKEAIVSIFNVE